MQGLKKSDYAIRTKMQWNNMVEGMKDVTFHDTPEYAMINLLLSGDSLNNIAFIDTCVVYCQSFCALYSGRLLRLAARPSKPFFKTVICMRPLLVEQKKSQAESFGRFLDRIESHARSKGALLLETGIASDFRDDDSGAAEGIYKEKGFNPTQRATVALDLGDFNNIDECWQNLKDDARNKVSKAKKDRIEVVEDSEFRYVDDYISLHKRMSYPITEFYRNRRLFDKVLDICNSESDRPMCRLFVTRKDDLVLSGQLLFVFNKNVILEGVVISDECRKKSWYANDLMQWHIISWAKANGCRRIDWGGYALSPTEKEKGINNFKLKWGGEIIKYKSYSKIITSWKYNFIRGLKRLKKGLQ